MPTVEITTIPVMIPPSTKEKISKSKKVEITLSEKKKEEARPEEPKTNFIVTQAPAGRGSEAKRAAPPASFMSLMRPAFDANPSNPISLSPSYEEICKMGMEELGAVENFKVFRKGSAMIEFKGPVSLIGVNISKAFDLGTEGSIRIYNIPQGFLGVPCTVTFYNCDKLGDVTGLMRRPGAHFDRDTNTLSIDLDSLSRLSQ